MHHAVVRQPNEAIAPVATDCTSPGKLSNPFMSTWLYKLPRGKCPPEDLQMVHYNTTANVTCRDRSAFTKPVLIHPPIPSKITYDAVLELTSRVSWAQAENVEVSCCVHQ